MFTKEQQKKFDSVMLKFKNRQEQKKCQPFFIDAETNLAGFTFAYIIADGGSDFISVTKDTLSKMGKDHPAYVYYQKFNSLPPKVKQAVFLGCRITLENMLAEERSNLYPGIIKNMAASLSLSV